MPAPMCYNHAVGAPARSDALAEAYRSGHNEAVLKTVWVQAHGGSNPSASATAEKCEPMRFAFFIASAEAEHNNEPLRRKLIAYFLHKIMRRRVRRRADASAKETLSYSRDAFARTTFKKEGIVRFALSVFAVPALWRISRYIYPFVCGARTHPKKRRRLIRATLSPNPKKCPRPATLVCGTFWGPRDPYGEYPATISLVLVACKPSAAGFSTTLIVSAPISAPHFRKEKRTRRGPLLVWWRAARCAAGQGLQVVQSSQGAAGEAGAAESRSAEAFTAMAHSRRFLNRRQP